MLYNIVAALFATLGFVCLGLMASYIDNACEEMEKKKQKGRRNEKRSCLYRSRSKQILLW